MEKRAFGRTDMLVSVLGFGGAEIGHEGADTATVARLLGSALDAGLNVIDTGECYGESEELIGKTVADRRDEFYLFTKAGHPHGQESGANWSPDSILESIERSLRRLRTDRVDLVHLHSCPEAILKKGDAIAALQTVREKGYTRYIGYSGDSHAADYAVACGAFDSLQISVNIADQEAIDHAIPAAVEAQMGVIAKRPLANVAWPPDISRRIRITTPTGSGCRSWATRSCTGRRRRDQSRRRCVSLWPRRGSAPRSSAPATRSAGPRTRGCSRMRR